MEQKYVWGHTDAVETFGQMSVFLLKKRHAEHEKGVLCFWAPILDALRGAGPRLSDCYLRPSQMGSGRELAVEFSEGRGRTAGLRSVSQGHYFRLFSPFLLSPLPAWRRRLFDRAGEEERKPLPGAPEHRATPAHLPLWRRRRNWERCADHKGAGRPRRRSGERRCPGRVVLRAARPTRDFAFAFGCPGDAVS